MWTIDLTNNVIWSRQAYCHLYCVATALNFYFIDALSLKMNFRRKIIKQAITYPKITNQDKLRLIQISAVLVVHPDLLLKKIWPGRLTGRHLRMINEHIALYWYFSTFTNHWPQWLKWKIWGEGTPIFSVAAWAPQPWGQGPSDADVSEYSTPYLPLFFSICTCVLLMINYFARMLHFGRIQPFL